MKQVLADCLARMLAVGKVREVEANKGLADNQCGSIKR